MNDATREALLRLYDVPDPERPGEVIPGYDKDHAGRTTRIAMRVAQAVGLPEERLEDFETTALLHDLGRAGMDPALFGRIFGLAEKRGLPVRIREFRARYPDITEEQAPAHFLDLISPALHEEGMEITPQVVDHVSMRMDFKGRLRWALAEVAPELRSHGLSLHPWMEKVMLYYYYPDGMEGEGEDVRLMGMILVACENFEAFNNWRRGRDYYGRAKERLEDVFAALSRFEEDGLVSAEVMRALKALTASGDLDSAIKESRGMPQSDPLLAEDVAFQRALDRLHDG